MEPGALEIRPVGYDHPDAEALVEELFADLNERYGSEDDGGDGWKGEVGPADVAPPQGSFLLAYEGGRAVACGGVKRWDERTAEIKRMYVAPDGRRRGTARTLLHALEDAARALGFEAIRLETGTAQPEAVRLYETDGYERIEPYGRYRESPMSVCFEKSLSLPSERQRLPLEEL